MEKECKNKEIGIQLHAYEVSALNDAMTEKFEEHILTCEYCFNKLQKFEKESQILKHGSVTKDLVLSSREKSQRSIWSSLTIPTTILATLVVVMIYPTILGISSMISSPIKPVDSITLVPVRSADNTFVLNQNNDVVISLVYPDSNPQKDYSIELYLEKMLILHVKSFNDFDSYNTGRILVPKENLAPGDYQCILKGNEINNGKILQQYTFRII